MRPGECSYNVVHCVMQNSGESPLRLSAGIQTESLELQESLRAAAPRPFPAAYVGSGNEQGKTE